MKQQQLQTGKVPGYHPQTLESMELEALQGMLWYISILLNMLGELFKWVGHIFVIRITHMASTHGVG